jgi:hypothetical protein
MKGLDVPVSAGQWGRGQKSRYCSGQWAVGRAERSPSDLGKVMMLCLRFGIWDLGFLKGDTKFHTNYVVLA